MFARPLMRRQWRLAGVTPASPMVIWKPRGGTAQPGAVVIRCLWPRVREFVRYITKPAPTGP